MKTNYPAILLLAFIGSIVATYCDYIHVITGVLGRDNPGSFKVLSTMFIIFFVAFVIMGIAYTLFDKYLPVGISRTFSTSPGTFRAFLESMLLFAFVYLLSGFGGAYTGILVGLIYCTYLLRISSTPDFTFMLIISVTLGIMGGLVESYMSSQDEHGYTNPNFMHIPAWLPGLYLHGAFALRDGMRLFVYGRSQ